MDSSCMFVRESGDGDVLSEGVCTSCWKEFQCPVELHHCCNELILCKNNHVCSYSKESDEAVVGRFICKPKCDVSECSENHVCKFHQPRLIAFILSLKEATMLPPEMIVLIVNSN